MSDDETDCISIKFTRQAMDNFLEVFNSAGVVVDGKKITLRLDELPDFPGQGVWVETMERVND